MTSSQRRRVKVVCTLGPASRTPERILRLVEAGMDVARLNFSHGDHDFHRSLVASIRDASAKAGRPVAILQDLQGPKLRVGKLPRGGIELREGDRLLLHPEGAAVRNGGPGLVAVPISAEIAKAVSQDVRPGARILFDDGRISTRVSKVLPPEIVVEVETGGKLTDHKGMNLPGTPLSLSSVTEKDLEDLKLGLELGVDAVALSFVRTAADIEAIRERMRKLGTGTPPLIVSKIEREEAVENQGSIIEVSDGLLIARGDMAVEVGAERVPIIQKQLIAACNEVGVPIITATQMLESMVASTTPTRAEANDVANAVFDGTDAVMLSAETASGKYPVEAVQTMARIILEAERAQESYGPRRENVPIAGSIVESIEFSASRIAHHTGAVAIACITHTGTAARTLAKFRPGTPIVAITDQESVLRSLAFVWGVRGVLIPKILSTDDLFAVVEKVLTETSWAEREDLVVVTAGIPSLRRGTTNMVKVHRVGSAIERPAKAARPLPPQQR